jgi:hypothetical protein
VDLQVLTLEVLGVVTMSVQAVWEKTEPGVWERTSAIDVDTAQELAKERLETLDTSLEDKAAADAAQAEDVTAPHPEDQPEEVAEASGSSA